MSVDARRNALAAIIRAEPVASQEQLSSRLREAGYDVTQATVSRDLETLGWRLMLIIPRAELFADARALLYRQLWLGALGLLALVAAISIVASGIARPVHALAAAVDGARDGDLDFRLPDTPRRDEIGVLTEALRKLRDSLQTHIRLRADSLAAQARLEHELEIAASIQQSMLPREAAVTSLPPGALVAAALLPARQVGGDLYDYFTLRDDNVLFAFGDVSDKGVPAALFMARLSGLLRVLGAAGEMPDRLLAGINARLVEQNDACMFVTVGCGLLNVRTGQVRYASAGHEPPLLRELGGAVRPWNADNGPAIGIDSAVEYQLREGYVAPGDTLVLFTDGVTEAADDQGALFGVERLGRLLEAAEADDPVALVQRVVDTVAAQIHKPAGLKQNRKAEILLVEIARFEKRWRRNKRIEVADHHIDLLGPSGSSAVESGAVSPSIRDKCKAPSMNLNVHGVSSALS